MSSAASRAAFEGIHAQQALLVKHAIASGKQAMYNMSQTLMIMPLPAKQFAPLTVVGPLDDVVSSGAVQNLS